LWGFLVLLGCFFYFFDEMIETFQAKYQEFGSATSKSTILPVSMGDTLPPAEFFFELGTKLLGLGLGIKN